MTGRDTVLKSSKGETHMTTPTPGPWAAEDDHDGYRIEGRGNPSGTVAVLTARRSVTGKADALLIAAAPETAAERDRLREVNADLLAALRVMVATVDRAKGQPVTFHEGMSGCSVTKARAAIAKATQA